MLYGDLVAALGARGHRSLLAEHPDIDAVLCGSDQIAAAGCRGLNEAGRRVPDDIAVTGYDNWGVFALETEPPLTTVDMNLEALGAAAAQELFQGMIDVGPRQGGIRRHGCGLIVRASTVGGP